MSERAREEAIMATVTRTARLREIGSIHGLIAALALRKTRGSTFPEWAYVTYNQESFLSK